MPVFPPVCQQISQVPASLWAPLVGLNSVTQSPRRFFRLENKRGCVSRKHYLCSTLPLSAGKKHLMYFSLRKLIYLHVNRYMKKKQAFPGSVQHVGSEPGKLFQIHRKLLCFGRAQHTHNKCTLLIFGATPPTSPAALLLKTILYTKACTVGAPPPPTHQWSWLCHPLHPEAPTSFTALIWKDVNPIR